MEFPFQLIQLSPIVPLGATIRTAGGIPDNSLLRILQGEEDNNDSKCVTGAESRADKVLSTFLGEQQSSTHDRTKL